MVICVAGMPRSGTSLVAQLLYRCGVNLGPAEQLMPASINNRDGFWENVRFVQVNERLLAASGGTWFAPPATLRPTPKITAEARSIVAQFDGQEPWLWKDPRNALALPFWKSLIPSMRLMVCVRHPAETALSLAASTLIPRRVPVYWKVTAPESQVRLRDVDPRFHRRLSRTAQSTLSRRHRHLLINEVALELWRIYNTSILEATTPHERLVTHYEAMLTRPEKELKRILSFAGLQVPSPVLDDALRVVSPRLRHQRAATGDLQPAVARLYAQLSREADYSLER